MNRKKGSAKNNVILHEVDVDELPTLTDTRKTKRQALSSLPDSAIAHTKPTKPSTTLRLLADVLAGFKGLGKGYQIRMTRRVGLQQV